MNSSNEGRHDDEAALTEFLSSLMDYTPTIPDELVEHYLGKSGFQCPDLRLTRLVAVATQKFITEIASDALQHCKARLSAPVKDKSKQPKEKRLVLTMDDLSRALREFASRNLGAFELLIGLTMLVIFQFVSAYGVNLKHPDYFADSPLTGMDPSSREE
ncbi:hypothetical protein MA16_Dca014910 [Dendrobium catenatum]|uniref:Transcription initiation factor TFIID subunit 10 n=1 Tax=Dendrobium catenatum TaxID=906689 RepID=A0A2I0WSK2_9ASPA|nr:hypothetical protein MA16_Dca014910 [Dendrobium catenatum]